MSQPSEFFELLCCPRCSAKPLERAASGLRCLACRTDFPTIGGIPWLLPEPLAALSEWRQRLQFLVQHLEGEAARIRVELQKPQLRAPTRTRLKLLAHGYQDQVRRLQALLAPLNISAATPLEVHSALRTRLPVSQGLTSYYANIHRDWCWGDEENEASFDAIRDALGAHPPGRTSGATRVGTNPSSHPTATTPFGGYFEQTGDSAGIAQEPQQHHAHRRGGQGTPKASENRSAKSGGSQRPLRASVTAERTIDVVPRGTSPGPTRDLSVRRERRPRQRVCDGLRR